ncbi:core histone macro-H2A.1 [Ochotona princeps]|uniref:core histone macro-H2A.1 n=1 Tax=Ochotona princeps TaxID=9978 RepID=UPI0027148240|nr:core histone macro-H2A.1 [Ochotona princeps]
MESEFSWLPGVLSSVLELDGSTTLWFSFTPPSLLPSCPDPLMSREAFRPVEKHARRWEPLTVGILLPPSPPLPAGRSRSAGAELTFSVSQVEQRLREGHYAQCLGWSAPLFLAATLTAKVLELVGIEAHNSGSQRITPRLLDTAIHNNPALSGLLGTTTISQVALDLGSRELSRTGRPGACSCRALVAQGPGPSSTLPLLSRPARVPSLTASQAIPGLQSTPILNC